MNLNQLKYFYAVYTYQTVSAAAEYLHISQPSLSGAIKELEQEFGVILFHRQHRGMVPTTEGEILFKMCGDLLGRAEQVENIMSDLGKERRVLRLGVPPMIGSLVLPYIYRDFSATYPDIKLEITEAGRKELVQKLSEDYLDMLLLPHNRQPEAEFASQQAARFEIVCCASKEHLISDYSTVSAKALDGVPLILFKNSFFQTEEIKKWFAHAGIKPDILLQTEQLSTMQSIITHNIAVGFMFRKLIEGNTELSAIPLEHPMYVDVSLVWKKDTYFFYSMKKFREYIQRNNPFDKI